MAKIKIIVAACLCSLISAPGLSGAHDVNVPGIERSVISLNGAWMFSMTPPANFWENNIDFQNWPNIQVPGECQMQGFAIKHDQPFVYKKKFSIPKEFAEKHIQLVFYGVYSYARVWVNGTFVRDHFGGFTRWDCDISNYVEPGTDAILTVEIIDRADDISYASGYAKHQIGGILRDVELTALPQQHFTAFYVETDFDDAYQHADLKIDYSLKQNAPASIKVQLFDSENTIVTSRDVPNAPQTGQFSIAVKNPQKWDAEHPHLYKIKTTLYHDGKELYTMTEKIGFREIKVDGNKLLVNGQPVKLRGANRHDIHPTLGRMTTAEYDLQDVLLAKECNMNFIRTSHYPPSEQFLRYCDEYGLYVEDETAVCFVGSHRTSAYKATGASQSNPDFTDRYLSQLEEMVQNHRNHPSVIIWSIGNENLFGENFVKSFKWVKENDPSRPVIFSYPGHVPESVELYDIISMHYPDWRGDLEQYGIKTVGFQSAEKPMLFDEWAHVACYNNFELKEDPNVRNFWGESLDRMWTTLFEADGALGGAIWCMIDETFMLPPDLPGFNDWWGILDKNIIPSTYMGPTVGYGEWGIIDTWRRKKPEFWVTKKAYSPTKIYDRQIDQFKPNTPLRVPVHNRFDHTNFNELTIKWRYDNQSGEITDIKLPPHQKSELIFPPLKWNTDDKLSIQFFQNDTFLVDEYNIQLGEKEIRLPVCKKGDLYGDESSGKVHISAADFSVEINKATGLLENLKIDNELMITSGPHINLKIPGQAVQYSTIKMENYAQNWTLENLDYSIAEGVARITTIGSYDSVSAQFDIQLDSNGHIVIDYRITRAPLGRSIQEAGLKFFTGDTFEKISWDRNAYFSAYPAHHLGRPVGEASLREKPQMMYRDKPPHSWELDRTGFYYFGLETELPFTNDVRSLKENIYSYALKSPNAEVEVISNGGHACRFDRIENRNILIVNDQWDYNSLMWGNYMKDIKSEAKFSGHVILTIKK